MKFELWEAKRLVRLATPVFLAQVTLVLMSVVDTMMAGQVSPSDLAALSIATGVMNPLMFSLQSILLAITSLVAHSHGAKDKNSIKRFFQQGLYLAVALSSLGFVASYFTPSLFASIGTEPHIAQLAQDYIDYVKYGLVAFLVFSVYRNVTEGMGNTKVAFYIGILGLCINVIANYIFIYGKLGMPALGGAGCGVATSIVIWTMAITQICYSLKSKTINGKWLISKFMRPHKETLLQIFKLGLPISFATFFEVTLFACIPLFIADLGAVAVSGHQVAASVTMILFMLPLSLSMAIGIRIGNISGQNDVQKLVNSTFTSFMLAIVIAAFVALATYIVRDDISWLYTQEKEVALLASSIIVLACVYQLPDALQVAANGVLRGLRYTKPITGVTFFSYWIIGFTLGYVLAKTDLIVPAMGPTGFWVGIIVGLSVAAVLLIYFVRRKLIEMQTARSA
ncbi:MATE family efflux transporter [Pseudoalteromonas sp. SMS1]|uniref:MATE family efflux transporter n=1 Tax=Pseudoalteromonas sp. SMS1 TaxID=2908894 RepID=UPI001F3C8206|nr:MATE family efflux transporter [Pseudoalteromonas sp. SMS1]MCF2859535.1 MATE family efflux transporter [Pseudoalteromonas sp. SMS1]